MDGITAHTHRPLAVRLAAALLAISSGITVVDLVSQPHSQMHIVTYSGTAVVALLFAWGFLQGRGWVRWALLAPVTMGLLASPGYFQHASTSGAVYFVGLGLLQVVALVLVFLKASNDWFRKQRNGG